MMAAEIRQIRRSGRLELLDTVRPVFECLAWFENSTFCEKSTFCGVPKFDLLVLRMRF